jgi:hypothetical protein
VVGGEVERLWSLLPASRQQIEGSTGVVSPGILHLSNGAGRGFVITLLRTPVLVPSSGGVEWNESVAR